MFDINFVETFKGLPPEIATFFISMIPIAELRASIPIALTVYKLSIFSAIFFSVIGEMIPVFLILTVLRGVYSFVEKYNLPGKRLFDWFFKRTKHKFEGKYEKYGSLALILFVAIPLPFSGTWSGSVAAFLFRIPFVKAFLLILTGVMLSAGIVTLLTLAGVAIF
ncbi:small multi-drug export protein [Candidatus Falkowbacteria bacterium]|jgi:uncharacterized membrane protein|nr:small multi-drug export protein [Candidatus Falkowbacteria bacterium]MBT4433417.1 small multi-drug export protein [Candidatus Falkowbacteria bacterium]